VTVTPTAIPGLVVIEFEIQRDERGSFARVFDREAFRAHGLWTEYPQHGRATNVQRGVVRGLHYQTAPFAEHKVVRCTRGTVWDVVLDARRGSPTYGRWEAFELDGERPRMLYLCAGLAHGYQTLSAESELHYLISAPYAPDHATGVNPRDGRLAIPWPLPVVLVSARDESLPALADAPDSTP
jgi:dTDP-4-dehydrorhamnose 3,5-epimerase